MNNDNLIPADKYPDVEDLLHTIAMLSKLDTHWYYVSDEKMTDQNLMLMHESVVNCKKRLEVLLPKEYQR
jgi:hypothetical protein